MYLHCVCISLEKECINCLILIITLHNEKSFVKMPNIWHKSKSFPNLYVGTWFIIPTYIMSDCLATKIVFSIRKWRHPDNGKTVKKAKIFELRIKKRWWEEVQSPPVISEKDSEQKMQPFWLPTSCFSANVASRNSLTFSTTCQPRTHKDTVF